MKQFLLVVSFFTFSLLRCFSSESTLPMQEDTKKFWAVQQQRKDYLHSLHTKSKPEILIEIEKTIVQYDQLNYAVTALAVKRVSESLMHTHNCYAYSDPQNSIMKITSFVLLTERSMFMSKLINRFRDDDSMTREHLQDMYFVILHHVYFEEFILHYLEKISGRLLRAGPEHSKEIQDIALDAYYLTFQQRYHDDLSCQTCPYYTQRFSHTPFKQYLKDNRWLFSICPIFAPFASDPERAQEKRAIYIHEMSVVVYFLIEEGKKDAEVRLASSVPLVKLPPALLLMSGEGKEPAKPSSEPLASSDKVSDPDAPIKKKRRRRKPAKAASEHVEDNPAVVITEVVSQSSDDPASPEQTELADLKDLSTQRDEMVKQKSELVRTLGELEVKHEQLSKELAEKRQEAETQETSLKHAKTNLTAVEKERDGLRQQLTDQIAAYEILSTKKQVLESTQRSLESQLQQSLTKIEALGANSDELQALQKKQTESEKELEELRRQIKGHLGLFQLFGSQKEVQLTQIKTQKAEFQTREQEYQAQIATLQSDIVELQKSRAQHPNPVTLLTQLQRAQAEVASLRLLLSQQVTMRNIDLGERDRYYQAASQFEQRAAEVEALLPALQRRAAQAEASLHELLISRSVQYVTVSDTQDGTSFYNLADAQDGLRFALEHGWIRPQRTNVDQ